MEIPVQQNHNWAHKKIPYSKQNGGPDPTVNLLQAPELFQAAFDINRFIFCLRKKRLLGL
jgi:hypothetical protein